MNTLYFLLAVTEQVFEIHVGHLANNLLLLACVPYFEIIQGGLWDHFALCVPVRVAVCLYVCMSVCSPNYLFYVRPVQYQRNVGDKFFPEPLAFYRWGSVWLSPVGTQATSGHFLLAQNDDDDDDDDDYDEGKEEYGAVSGMIIERGDWNILKKPTLVPLCSPQIKHDLTWPGIEFESPRWAADD
jgi:hypothetical protein